MTKSTLKGLLAGIAAVAVAGAAIAQSTPPNPTAKDPSVGAGQRSTQNTPMGSTGTPTNSGSAGATGSRSTGSAGGSTGGSTMNSSGSTTGSSMGASGSSTDTSTTTTKSSDTMSSSDSKTTISGRRIKKAKSRKARADRN